IADRSVPHILKLADQFQMERVVKQSEKHLMKSTSFDEMKKLLLADQYRLASLQDQCLDSFTNATELAEKLKLCPEYDIFSADMKVAICDRI
ncbi:hypothetical protein PMAYCL1PPCAC_01567, partial [Pristionchus mayeri]